MTEIINKTDAETELVKNEHDGASTDRLPPDSLRASDAVEKRMGQPQQGEMPFAVVLGEALTELPKDLYIPPRALEVFLEAFEGPLDLLLYLIRRQNLNILDIDVASITEQYMQYVDLMDAMQFELAAEYLLMAAMLAEIKSRMLLPRSTEVGWHVIRGRCLFEALLGGGVQMPAQIWKRVTLVSALHFAMVGAVNLYVAYNYSMETWVSFKLWSSLGFSVLLILLIGVVMGPHLKEVANSDENKNTTTF